MEPRMILFVCTGNICRSPMAEYLLRHRLGPGAAWTVASAGTSAITGVTASAAAVTVLRERGIDLTPHRSQPLTRDLVDDATLVLVMTTGHRDILRAVYPEATEKSFLLRSFDTVNGIGDIADPIGMTAGVYREIRNEIEACLPGLAAFMQTLK